MPTITFEAKPYKIGTYTILRLPEEASKNLPSRGQVFVKGTINGNEFQAALEPDGRWSHWLDLADTPLTDARPGDTVELEIEATKDWPEPKIPADWQAAIDTHPEIQDLWAKVTPMARWEWIRWINCSGNPATRLSHIDVSVDKLRKGMHRPCCFNRNMCCVPEVSKSGVLLEPALVAK